MVVENECGGLPLYFSLKYSDADRAKQFQTFNIIQVLEFSGTIKYYEQYLMIDEGRGFASKVGVMNNSKDNRKRTQNVLTTMATFTFFTIVSLPTAC